MIYYSVYDIKEIREKCDCGHCINLNGFKNTLTTWHANKLLFTDSIEKVNEFIKNNNNYIAFKAKYSGTFEQQEDYIKL
jgi:hypothetical protein